MSCHYKKMEKETETTPVKHNYAAFIRAVQLHSGKTMKEFCAAAGVNQNTPRFALQRGNILLKTAMRLLAANGYVCVLRYTFRETPEYLIIDDLKEDPFDVDWKTFRQTDYLKAVYRNDPDLFVRAAHKLEITDRAIRYVFQNDNGDLSRIYELADCAGLDCKMLIKKDEKAAKIVSQRLFGDEIIESE